MSGASEYVILTLEFYKEEGVWYGQCRELGTTTEGKALEPVREDLIELVGLELNGLEVLGERQRFFREHSIPTYPSQPDRVPVHVPTHLPVTPSPGPLVEACVWEILT